MYGTLTVFSLATVLAACAPVNKDNKDDAQASILRSDFTNDGRGNYEFRYETSNGLFRLETGEVVNAGKKDEHIAVRGRYSYVNADGGYKVVQYIADENGYQIHFPVENNSPSSAQHEYSTPTSTGSEKEDEIPDRLNFPPAVVGSLLGG